MDRSRLIVTLAMILSMISVILGFTGIAMSSRSAPFARASSDSFFTSGRSGIAVIKIHGDIRSGYSTGSSVGADDLIQEIKTARDSSSIRAVIIDINSPGGTVGATKIIYEAVKDLRKEKPVAAVITDIGASGGYYVASACDKIFAQQGSIVGSIGVIAFHGDISGLLNDYGIKISSMKAGKYKDSSYPFRAMSAEEKDMMQEIMNDSYEQFLTDVSEGRGQPIKSVRAWGEGRIFSGKTAKAEQMIDEIGGKIEAVQALKVLLKTNDDLPLFEKKEDFMERFMKSLPGLEQNRMASSLTNSHIYYLYPSSIQIIFESMQRIRP
ncbi:MAG: signal peptide peptidase SppA [Spirochaetia bacterium]|nr:signal peptide peptidase SppA [Spirochaetia bacterium]